MTASHNLSWLPDELVPVAFRLARADTVAGELGDVCLSWSRGNDDNGPLELVQVARELGFLDLDVKSIRPVPPIAAMLFSEAINHLRSALDNVVYYLAEQANGHAFTSQEASLVQFFIRSDQAAYDKKVAELASKRGLSQLAPGHLLGDRMRALQPFNDARTVPAIPVGLTGALVSDGTPDLHPLLLLQRYSNDDKHRNLRLAGARTVYRRDEGPPEPAAMRPVQVSDTLDRIAIDTYNESTTMPALSVQRPDGGPWVSPGHELDHLFNYVADTAIPRLVTGLELPDAFPAQIDLTDNGATDQGRLEAAENTRAHDRMRAASMAAFFEAFARPPKWPVIVDPND